MNRSSQLQFQRLPPEAQRATLRRLAVSGLSSEQMAERTGWPVEQVRRATARERARSDSPWKKAGKRAEKTSSH